MKNIIITILLLIYSLHSVAQNNPDAILGKWITLTGNCIVEVYKQKDEFKARVLWFTENNKPMKDWVDEKNPDPSLRTRKLLGMEVLHGLHYAPDEKEWVDGFIYDATTGKEWDSVVWLTNNNLLKVKGYWVFKFLSETKTFKRI